MLKTSCDDFSASLDTRVSVTNNAHRTHSCGSERHGATRFLTRDGVVALGPTTPRRAGWSVRATGESLPACSSSQSVLSLPLGRVWGQPHTLMSGWGGSRNVFESGTKEQIFADGFDNARTVEDDVEVVSAQAAWA